VFDLFFELPDTGTNVLISHWFWKQANLLTSKPMLMFFRYLSNLNIHDITVGVQMYHHDPACTEVRTNFCFYKNNRPRILCKKNENILYGIYTFILWLWINDL